MIMKTCTFILQSRGYGKTYYENKKKEEENKNKNIKKGVKYEKNSLK